MKNQNRAILASITIFFIGLVVYVSVVSNIDSNLAAIDLSEARLEELESSMNAVEASRRTPSIGHELASIPTSSTPSAQSTLTAPDTLPHLKRAPTQDDREKLFAISDFSERMELRFRSSGIKFFEGIGYYDTTSTIHNLASLGYDHMALGEWDKAESYLEAALREYEDTDPTQAKFVLGVLSWHQKDPEVASRMLEISCEGPYRLPYPPYEEMPDFGFGQLWNAWQLSVATGSDELDDHYFERMRKEFPDKLERMGYDLTGDSE